MNTLFARILYVLMAAVLLNACASSGGNLPKNPLEGTWINKTEGSSYVSQVTFTKAQFTMRNTPHFLVDGAYKVNNSREGTYLLDLEIFKVEPEGMNWPETMKVVINSDGSAMIRGTRYQRAK